MIIHGIYKAFDSNRSLEMRGVFLGLLKASDKVWHQGLLYKLKLGICEKYFGLVDSSLSDTY